MKIILRCFSWFACLFLRASIAVLSWAHERLNNGPSARLWLAKDTDLMAEAQKRGLLKKLRVEAAPTQADQDVEMAAKAIAKLNDVPMKEAMARASTAANAVTLSGMARTVQNILTLALKPAA